MSFIYFQTHENESSTMHGKCYQFSNKGASADLNSRIQGGQKEKNVENDSSLPKTSDKAILNTSSFFKYVDEFSSSTEMLENGSFDKYLLKNSR